jgi:hypothetical protein
MILKVGISSYKNKNSILIFVENYELSGYVVFILLIAYMTIASVLLINLLIAMFR